jgi:hypothetical protein
MKWLYIIALLILFLVNQSYSQLSFSTYLGGLNSEFCTSAFTGKNDQINVFGETISIDFPTTPGAYDITNNGDSDFFITVLNRDASSLLFSTFIGGKNSDQAGKLVLDSNENFLLIGTSESINYPVTPLAYNKTNNGEGDVVITKLNSAGSNIIYSSYLGGSSTEYGSDIKFDSLSNNYITGFTYSSDFPTTPGAYNRTFQYDVFGYVVKIDSTLSNIIFATYIGDSLDRAHRIIIDKDLNSYVSGSTRSRNFPTTPNAWSRTNQGIEDAFITKLNPLGSSLIYSTLLGGTDIEESHLIGKDADNNIIVPGETYSSDFPVMTGAYQKNFNGGNYDGTVTKLDATGSNLIYSTYLGGSMDEIAYCLALDSQNNSYITGYTTSINFPVTSDAYQPLNSGSNEIYLFKLNTDGSKCLYSTYFGGKAYDCGWSISINNNNKVILGGITASLDFPVTPSAYDKSFNGANDAFVSEFNFFSKPILQVGEVSGKPGDIVEVPIYLKHAESLNGTGITSFKVDLSFNSTLLVPVEEPKGTELNLLRTIPLTLPVIPDTSSIIGRIKMIVGLGNAMETPLKLSNFIEVGGSADIDLIDGKFTLLGVCQEGGNRLLNPADTVKLMLARPNPAGSDVEIGYQLSEAGITHMFITNMNGEVIKTLFDKEISDFNYNTIKVNTGDMSSGSYFVILQTLTEKQSLKLEVVK